MRTKQNKTRVFSQKRFVIAVILLSSLLSSGQIKNAEPISTEKTTFLLPDGKVFNIEKLDSLNGAWGKNRVLFKHNEEDDKNNIIWLVRQTDEMKQEMERRKKTLSGMTNQTAPDFTLTDTKGKQWHLNELTDKVVVLNFWFTSCAPCIQEMPELNKLVDDFKNQNVVFLGLSYNSQEQVEKFLKNRQFKYTILTNSKEVDSQYKVSSWPTSMVIDKNGIIKFVTNASPKIREELTTVINSLLQS